MFKLWASHFISKYQNVQINTANTGSGLGQAFVVSGQYQIGGSAAYFRNDQIQSNPNLLNFLNIPLAVTDTLVEYNVPNIPATMHLNFTATLLTQIYNTTVQFWNDPRIIAINPGAASILSLLRDPRDSKLPGLGIWPYYRSDAAADTWLFTQYLATVPWWNATVGPPNLSVNFPHCVANFTITPAHQCGDNIPQGALGNPGIVIQAGPVVGSISYVSVEALDQWVLCKTQDPLCKNSHLNYGLLQNQAGNFIDPSNGNSVQAALDALSSQTPTDERISLANAPGPDSYPIVGYGYALVNKQQLNPDFATVLRSFLTYCILPNFGSAPEFLTTYHFTPLPAAVLQLTLNQIALIGP